MEKQYVPDEPMERFVKSKDDFIKISENQYVFKNPEKIGKGVKVIINTSCAAKTKEESLPLERQLLMDYYDILFRQELQKRGLDIPDLY